MTRPVRRFVGRSVCYLVGQSLKRREAKRECLHFRAHIGALVCTILFVISQQQDDIDKHSSGNSTHTLWFTTDLRSDELFSYKQGIRFQRNEKKLWTPCTCPYFCMSVGSIFIEPRVIHENVYNRLSRTY